MDSIVGMLINKIADQEEKYGVSDHPHGLWLAIMTEETGEVAKAIIEGDVNELRLELIDVMATCYSWLQAIERKVNKPS